MNKTFNIYAWTAVFTVMIIVNIVTLSNAYGLLLTLFQFLMVIYYLVKGDLRRSVLLHFSFIALSLSAEGTLGMFEDSSFALFNYGTIKLIGPVRGCYMMNIIYMMFLCNQKYGMNKGLLFYKLFKTLLYLGVSAFVIGGLGVIFNSYYSFEALTGKAIYMFVVLSTCYILLKLANEQFIRQAYYLGLTAVLSGIIGSFICNEVFGVVSHYSVFDIAYRADIVGIGAPAIIIGIIYIKQKLLAFTALALYGYILLSAFSGKSFFALCFAVMALLYIVWFDKKQKNIVGQYKLMLGIVVVVAIAIVVCLAMQELTPDSFAMYKIQSALSVFSGDYDDMSASPYIRFASLLNILYEGLQNPLTLLFGNGYGGYFEDKLRLFSGLDLSKGAWTDEVISTGRFTSGHDTIVTVPLFNGLIGLGLLIKIGWLYIKRIPNNYMCSIAVFWFILKFYFNTLFAFMGPFLLIGAEYNILSDNKSTN